MTHKTIPAPLRKRSEFLALRKGGMIKNRFFLLQSGKRDVMQLSSPTELPRLGFTVSKKNGNAVKRNRIKRRLREAAYQAVNWSNFSGYDYNLIAYHTALDAPFPELVKAIEASIANATVSAAEKAYPIHKNRYQKR